MAATYTTAKNGSMTTTGAGDDIIDGGDFNTSIMAGNGTNLVRTGKKDDKVKTGNGNDFIDAGDGNNTVDAGKGNNRVLTGKGNDTVTIGAGKSTVSTGAGNDTINALFGNSVINAGTGQDRINLGGGNNRIVLEAGAGYVTIAGFDITKDKLRLGESLSGKTLTFVNHDDHTHVMAGNDVLAVIGGVTNATTALIETSSVYKYAATELGSFNTTDKNASAQATSINDFGQIGGRYNTAFTYINENATTAVTQSGIIRQGFVWQDGKLSALTSIGTKKGQSDFGAKNGETVNMLTPNVNTISDRGVILGTGDEVRQPIGLATDRALVWDKQKSGYKLTINDLGGIESYFFDTNNSQQIVGRNILANFYEKPVLVEKGVVTELGTLGGDGGTARGMNNKGQIVGFVDKDGVLDENAVNTAAIWEKDASGVYKFKNLGTFGAAQASLREINDAGQIIGMTTNGLSGTAAVSNAFILRGGKFTDLGSLGGKTASVNGINSFGAVVGASQTKVLGGADGKTLESHAFIWSDGKMTDLNSLVNPITYNGAKVVLTSAVAINNFGDIAATGSFVYKDAVTKKDTLGTRAYELKGIANKIVTGGGSNGMGVAANSVAKAITQAPVVLAAGKSVVNAATNIIAPVGTGIGTTSGIIPLETVNPLLAANTTPNLGIG
jgi:probable HAF family extracellular repeat protein